MRPGALKKGGSCEICGRNNAIDGQGHGLFSLLGGRSPAKPATVDLDYETVGLPQAD